MWTWLILFPRARCLMRLLLLRLDLSNFDRYDIYFRDDSILRLAETGAFQGRQNILEYNLAGSREGPYFSTPLEIVKQDFSFLNYNMDDDTGVCNFRVNVILSQTSNPINTAGEVTFRSAVYSRIALDLKDGYVKVLDTYLGRGFWDVALRTIQDSDQTRNFVCSVMENECASVLPPNAATNCTERLEALPYVTVTSNNNDDDNVLRFQQDSQSCRAVHAALAQNEPLAHCAHISFEPMADPKGIYKCQNETLNTETLYTHSDLFSEEELEQFRKFVASEGLDETGISII